MAQLPPTLQLGRGTCQCSPTSLNSGADVNVGNIGGQTALHEAAEAGQEAACQELLKHKADPSLRDSDSRTAADLARANELPRLAELLSNLLQL